MSVLTSTDFISNWAGRLQEAVDNPPSESFDGRRDLPDWLAASARDQAERVFLALDATPVEERDMADAEHLVETSGRAVLTAWADLMEVFGSGDAPWAMGALETAALAYRDRLDELAPSLHEGGRA